MKNILYSIGNTPLINIEGIWVKMEYLNPSGSIKARIAKYIVEKAEEDGLLKPGDTIVEASSGNTGNAMSMVAAVKGYKMLVLMPDGMSPERTAISQAFGAEVKKMGDFHVNAALAEAKRLGDLPGYFSPQQFDNDQNVDENREWLGQEILKQLPGKPDLVVSGVGTGGTVIGVGQAFKAVNPDCKVIALEPSESCTILCGEIDKHLIEGIADGFIPGIIENHRDEIDGVVDVHSHEAIEEMRRIARVHGIFVGPSSGAHLIAAKRLKEKYNVENVVTFFCDEGEKYINDYWIKK
jgi:cysteine synthase A